MFHHSHWNSKRDAPWLSCLPGGAPRARMIVLVRILASGALLGGILLLWTWPASATDRATEDTRPVDIFDAYTGKAEVDWMECCHCHTDKC